MIEIPKTINKSDIALLGALKGKTNAGPMTLASTEFATGQLRFVGFAGAATAERTRYSGVLQFEPVDNGAADHADRCMFDFLDGPVPAPPPRAHRAEKAKRARP